MDKRRCIDMNKKNLNNRGFSLIELIVVVLITAIISGGIVTSMVVIRDADVSAASKKLVSMLTAARSYTIAKSGGTVWFELAREESGSYYAYVYQGDKSTPGDAEILSSEKIGGKSLTFKVRENLDDGSAKVTQVTDSTSVKFNFIKASGALAESYTDITVEGGSDKVENIIIIRETGRCIREF